MNKTLKILLAVVLFAVVLTIAGSVNAAETVKVSEILADLNLDTPVKYMNDFTLSDQAGTPVLTLKKEFDKDIVVDANVVIATADAGKDLTGTVIIDNTLYLQGEGIVSGIIENNGTLVAKEGTISGKVYNNNVATIDGATVSSTIYNKKELTIKSGTVTGLTVENSGTLVADVAIPTVNLANGGKVIASVKPTDINYDAAINDTYVDDTTPFETVSTPTKYYYISKSDVTLGLEVVYGASEATQPLVKDNVYTVKVTAKYGDVELNTTGYTIKYSVVGDANFVTAAGTVQLKSDELVAKKITADVEFNGVELKGAVINTGAKVDDNNEDNNNPADKDDDNNDNNVNNNEEDNKDENKEDKELDPDTPNTGDHIIPATALLAVVVVANVVYFAKMKRN